MSPQAFPQDKKWLALALLALAQFVVVLDASIVNVALPSIGTDLNFAQDDLSWVVNSYTLFFGGFLLLGGRMADLLGRRRMFVAGLILFALASLAGGLATSPGFLIAARAVQGLGAALLSPAALSLVTVMFAEGAERNKALGVWGAVAGSGGAAGVLLGGVLTEYAGWEWVLFVNVPIGLAAAFFATRLLPESRNAGARHFDIAGAVTVTAGLSLLVYTLVDANDAGWLSGQTLGLGAVALALLGGVRRHRAALEGAAGPVRDLPQAHDHRDQHRRPARRDVAVLDVLLRLALHAAGARLRRAQGRARPTCRWRSGSSCRPASRRALVTKVGFKPVLVTGLVLTAIGLVWFAQVDVDGTYLADILFPSLIAAVGLGFAFVPMTIGAVSGVEPHEAGLASGLINTSQQVGGALGLAILASIANSHTDGLMADAGGDPSALPSALTEGFQVAFMVGAGFAVLGAILAATLISSRESREHAEAAQRGEVAAVPAAA